MELMENEKIIHTTESKELTLTSHRIRYTERSSGSGNVISFLLSELDSCGIIYRSYPIYLVMACLTLAGVFIIRNVERGQSGTVTFIILTLLFIITYFVTRKSVLKISSKSSNIFVKVKRLGIGKILAFIDAAESAKNNYMK